MADGNGKPRKERYAICFEALLDAMPTAGTTAIAVFVALASYADQSRFCYPSIETIMANTGLGRRTVQRAIAKLKYLGLIQVHASSGQSNRYTLLDRGVTSGATSPEEASPAARGGAANDAGGVTSGARGVSPEAQEQYQLTNTKEQDQETVFREFKKTFVAEWNSLSGAARIRQLTDTRQSALKARFKSGDEWPWREAMAKFPLKCFEEGDWRPNVDWFLRPGTVNSILEGKYDFKKDNRNGNGNPGPGQKYDPKATRVGNL